MARQQAAQSCSWGARSPARGDRVRNKKSMPCFLQQLLYCFFLQFCLFSLLPPANGRPRMLRREPRPQQITPDTDTAQNPPNVSQRGIDDDPSAGRAADTTSKTSSSANSYPETATRSTNPPSSILQQVEIQGGNNAKITLGDQEQARHTHKQYSRSDVTINRATDEEPNNDRDDSFTSDSPDFEPDPPASSLLLLFSEQMLGGPSGGRGSSSSLLSTSEAAAAAAATGNKNQDPGDQNSVATNFLQLEEHQTERQKEKAAFMFGPGFMMARMVKSLLKMCAAVAIFAVCLSFLKGCCTAENFNLRNLPGVGKLFLKLGIDEFEDTKILVEIVQAKDLKGKGEKSMLLSDNQFTATVAFWYEKFETDPSVKCDFGQTRMMTIPQGASTTTFSATSIGTVSNTQIGALTVKTKRDILDREKSFWGSKQTYRLKSLEENGKMAGTLIVKFRRLSPEQEANYFTPLVKGIDNESGLGAECMKIALKLNLPDTLRNIEGELKCRILGEVLHGQVKEVDKGVEQETMYMKVQYCALGRVDFSVRQMEAQKAAKKGLNAPKKSFYFCVYESKKIAESMAREPVVFTAISSVKHVKPSTKRVDEFTVKWQVSKHQKDDDDGPDTDDVTLRTKDKDRDIIVEALDHLQQELLHVNDSKDTQQETAEKKTDFQKVSQQAIEANGCPSTAEDWTGWHDLMTSQGADENTVKEIYRDLALYIENEKIDQEWKKKLEPNLQKEHEFYDDATFWRRDLPGASPVPPGEAPMPPPPVFQNYFDAPPPPNVAEVDGLAHIDITGPPPNLQGPATVKGKGGKAAAKGTQKLGPVMPSGGDQLMKGAVKNRQQLAQQQLQVQKKGPIGGQQPDYAQLNAGVANAHQMRKMHAEGEAVDAGGGGGFFGQLGGMIDGLFTSRGEGDAQSPANYGTGVVLQSGYDSNYAGEEHQVQLVHPFLLPKLIRHTGAADWPGLGFTGWEQKQVDDQVLHDPSLSGTDKIGHLFGFQLHWNSYPKLFVSAVAPNSRANSVGVNVGDMLLAVNGQRVGGKMLFPVLADSATGGSSQVSSFSHPDDAVASFIMQSHLETAAQQQQQPKPIGKAKPVAQNFVSFLFLQRRFQSEYLQLELTEQDLGLSVNANSAIAYVHLGGWAGQHGLRAGDEFLMVNEELVVNNQNLLEQFLNQPRTGHPLQLLLRRRGGFEEQIFQHEAFVEKPLPVDWEQALSRPHDDRRESVRDPTTGMPVLDLSELENDLEEKQHYNAEMAGVLGAAAKSVKGKKGKQAKTGLKGTRQEPGFAAFGLAPGAVAVASPKMFAARNKGGVLSTPSPPKHTAVTFSPDTYHHDVDHSHMSPGGGEPHPQELHDEHLAHSPPASHLHSPPAAGLRKSPPSAGAHLPGKKKGNKGKGSKSSPSNATFSASPNSKLSSFPPSSPGPVSSNSPHSPAGAGGEEEQPFHIPPPRPPGSPPPKGGGWGALVGKDKRVEEEQRQAAEEEALHAGDRALELLDQHDNDPTGKKAAKMEKKAGKMAKKKGKGKGKKKGGKHHESD
ncbi:unnamed protein product [Amoebophrya sp. A120]|nr:unnamed protein product [Amoebophrya sp. A120]|eukprot:GSA120T00007639001.1